MLADFTGDSRAPLVSMPEHKKIVFKIFFVIMKIAGNG